MVNNVKHRSDLTVIGLYDTLRIWGHSAPRRSDNSNKKETHTNETVSHPRSARRRCDRVATSPNSRCHPSLCSALDPPWKAADLPNHREAAVLARRRDSPHHCEPAWFRRRAPMSAATTYTGAASKMYRYGRTNFPKQYEVTPNMRCPVCGHASECSVNFVGDLVLCRHQPSANHYPERNGWMHDVHPNQAGGTRGRHPSVLWNGHRCGDSMSGEFELYKAQLGPTQRSRFAAALSVLPHVLDQFQLGWFELRNALAIPAMVGQTEIVGVRFHQLSPPDPRKPEMALFGSKALPLLPLLSGLYGEDPLYVTEEVSDAFAGAGIGLHTCARWGRNISPLVAEIIADHADAAGTRRICIVGSADPESASATQQSALAMQTLRPDFEVRVVFPPSYAGTLRDWIASGPSPAAIVSEIENAQ